MSLEQPFSQDSLSNVRPRNISRSNDKSTNSLADQAGTEIDQNPETKVSSIRDVIEDNEELKQDKPKKLVGLSRFFSINLVGSLESGSFGTVNDVFVKYSIVAGPDWLLSSGTDVGITQMSRYRLDENGARKFVWNQPITLSYRSYNYFGWPQLVLSVFYFDILGNQQILGYGSTHMPVACQIPCGLRQVVKIYAPQSSTLFRQVIGWITGRRPELVDSNSFARGDCRNVLQASEVGQVDIIINLTTKDSTSNGYVSG